MTGLVGVEPRPCFATRGLEFLSISAARRVDRLPGRPAQSHCACTSLAGGAQQARSVTRTGFAGVAAGTVTGVLAGTGPAAAGSALSAPPRFRRVVGRGGPGRRRCSNSSSRYCSQERPTASCCQSATRTVRLGGHVQSGTRRVAKKKAAAIIPFVNKNPHQRASYWLRQEMVNDLGTLAARVLSGLGEMSRLNRLGKHFAVRVHAFVSRRGIERRTNRAEPQHRKKISLGKIP